MTDVVDVFSLFSLSSSFVVDEEDLTCFGCLTHGTHIRELYDRRALVPVFCCRFLYRLPSECVSFLDSKCTIRVYRSTF